MISDVRTPLWWEARDNMGPEKTVPPVSVLREARSSARSNSEMQVVLDWLSLARAAFYWELQVLKEIKFH